MHPFLGAHQGFFLSAEKTLEITFPFLSAPESFQVQSNQDGAAPCFIDVLCCGCLLSIAPALLERIIDAGMMARAVASNTIRSMGSSWWMFSIRREPLIVGKEAVECQYPADLERLSRGLAGLLFPL